MSAPTMTLRAFMLAGALATAPFQCSRTPDPDSAIEETPAEALYRLAGEFRARGDVAAWRSTLEHLVRRYPGSRLAHTAADDLAAGPAAPASPGAVIPSGAATTP